jgi:CheY-like chemotaxis protein
MPITVSIVEDDRVARESLVALLGGHTAFRCVGAHANGEEALAGVLRDRPEIAIVDINLPGMSGIECVARLKAALPGLLVLMLTTYEESDSIFESLRAGANGYLLKKSTPTDLVAFTARSKNRFPRWTRLPRANRKSSPCWRRVFFTRKSGISFTSVTAPCAPTSGTSTKSCTSSLAPARP